ncbi:MAG: phosphoglucosamine mutase [Phycisphaerales bacterium]|nr:phosphoglucosamine mutase [Phycisphaerales bacterium]
MSTLMLSVSGCRGVVGQTLTPEVVARFAGAYASFLRERMGQAPSVVLGRDGRAGSAMVHHAAIAGLLGAGAHVIDLGVASTPTIAVMTDEMNRRQGGHCAGMVLTASHNPQAWNGLKCLLAEGGLHGSAACAPPATLAAGIIERFKAANVEWQGWEGVGSVDRDESSIETHVDRVMRALEDSGMCVLAGRLGEGFRVALDSVNGAGAAAGRMMLESLSVDEVMHLGAGDDGLFPHPPEPTRENLGGAGGLCDAVREGECDIGFAQDPDADRLAIIDEQGRYIGEEYTLALSALALLEGMKAAGTPTKGLALVTNLSTSRMIDDIAARFEARVIRTPVGEANVVEAMKREGSPLGGEGNGGTIWPRVTYVRDSLASMAMVLWLMSPLGGGRGERRRLSAIVGELPSYAIEKRKVDLRSKDQASGAVEAIARAFASEKVDRSDGVWVDFASRRSWLHVRASNTEPIMRLIAEAPTSAQANALLDEAARVIG